MKSQYVEAAAKVVHDAPMLINAVSKRVRQLHAGAHPLVDVDPAMDTADIALHEIAEGKIEVVIPPEVAPADDE